MLERFKVCYHGTAKRSADFIDSKGINLNKSVKGTDFGQGFYVTSNFKQAEEWSVLKRCENYYVIDVICILNSYYYIEGTS